MTGTDGERGPFRPVPFDSPGPANFRLQNEMGGGDPSDSSFGDLSPPPSSSTQNPRESRTRSHGRLERVVTSDWKIRETQIVNKSHWFK